MEAHGLQPSGPICVSVARAATAQVGGGGAKAGLGSHGEVQGIGTHWELWMMAAGGMKAHDALRSATLDGADSIGLSKDIGSLEVGKMADLLVLDANPLENLEHHEDFTGDEERPAARCRDVE